MRRLRIAILHHARDTRWSIRAFAISRLSEIWEEDGHTVIHLFGTDRYVPADVVIVHIDLSVVPDEYLAFARQYPIALNDEVRDIRKRTFSEYLVGPDDPWDGPVIVKSDLNYAGIPERSRLARYGRLRTRLSRLFRARGLLASPGRYRIFSHLREVPARCFHSPEIVVQRFLAEYENGLYHVRYYQFFGDTFTCSRIASRNPIVTVEERVSSVPVELHPEVVALRHRLRFDFGKFDYVVTAAGPVVLDVNKTVGGGRVDDPVTRERRRIRATGLYSYFREGPADDLMARPQ